MPNLKTKNASRFFGSWLFSLLFLICISLEGRSAGAQTGQPIKLGIPKSLGTVAPGTSPSSQTPEPVDNDQGAPQIAPGTAPILSQQTDPENSPPQNHVNKDAGDEGAKAPLDERLVFKNLQTPSIATIGILTPENGGFEATLWQGTSAEIAHDLLSHIATGTQSATINKLLRRLLLAAATPPESAVKAADTQRFFEVRVQTLVQLGALDEALNLMMAVPKGSRSAAFIRQATEIAFLSPDLGQACGDVRQMLSRSDDLFWLRASIVCDTLDGSLERVELDSRLLNEIGDPDSRFNRLTSALLGGETPSIENADGLAPESFAIAGLSGGARQVDNVKTVAPKWITALVKAPSTPFNARLQLAERAVSLGLMGSADLQILYQEVQVNDTRLDQLLTLVENDPDAQASALLFRAAESQESALARAQLITQAFTLAEKRQKVQALAAPLAEIVLEMPVISQLDWFAATAVRILIAANRGTEATDWSRLASRAKTQPQMRAWAQLWPLTYLANGAETIPWDGALIDQWWQLKQDEQTPEKASKKVTLLALLQTMGGVISDDAWRSMVTPVNGPPVMVMPLSIRQAITIAVREKRLAETILLSAIALSAHPLNAFSGSDLLFLVTALKDLGLQAEARQFALDIAFAGRL